MIHHFYLTVTIVRLESEKVRERMLGCATELDLDQLEESDDRPNSKQEWDEQP
jgi:hypothetical protein